ncbi:hypothetical protein H6G06_04565 [Anabaena sphaerica FACHB-251]|uniref:Uncharacterized protein n=1 Tax=Anabaena sphaerica FACHB-251 TaxID=2692883 RepID=A0A927A0W3_9NOST|nr:hypothetical protein [Anabaena sphaerica]MBD2292775.1 hypothetical protein [Anabaena sphaerica FACHB-251]
MIEPIPISYQLVEGKQVSEQIFKGSLIKLSVKGAEVKIESEEAHTLPRPLGNIKMNLLIINNQEPQSEDIYAKVLDKPATPGNFYLQFTFKPPAEAGMLFKALFQSIRASSSYKEFI